jgi:RAB6A-GEF complex partner protein 2
VLRQDEARVRKIVGSALTPVKEHSISGPTWTSSSGFLTYVDGILKGNIPRDPLLSITTTPQERPLNQDLPQNSPSCKDAIDLAILRSNQITNSNRSANRFEIARNGRRIAVIVLNRPSHRLGETVIATVDFADSTLPCYSLRATLETSEKITPSLAMRSNTSISRATRRIHASHFENTLFSTRVVFSPAIPISATPTILTSYVNLEWELRFEFVTAASPSEDEASPSGVTLLESIGEDDRGSVFASLESLSCESFEITLPLTVYGETVREPAVEENQGYPI